ncbi:hypothetical protein O2N63_03620 [Aliiroseovarius sp. KMU-50]|uniref:LPXTG cell wall anchor domain-containing protein n=1 Tax=Aliiroseovarius salicola TaxID=3009082 RepID=A0ABT4W005_9RHOB|nr:DUF6732 family protein [Aliiroseovarius sp. KMU-50]MDA5093167.1 hypothetical protein [Aliiroseovarius sp. KMU-50]
MSKSLLLSAAVVALTTAPAMAHIGHLGEVAGHGHWGAIIFLGGAAAVGLWAAIKGKKDAEKAEAEGAEEDAEEEIGDEELVGA